MSKGNVQGHFAFHFRQTAKILQELREEGILFEGTPFGFAFFSTLHGGASIQAHTAPMNLRLRIHLPLIVPEDNLGDPANLGTEDENLSSLPACGLRVGPLVRPWTAGKAMVLGKYFKPLHQCCSI